MRALVSVGFGCNNRCVFCAQGDLRFGDEGRVPDDEVRARIVAARPADALTLAGGEPTTRSELTTWATFARETGFSSVQVQTNGRRLSYRRYATEIAKAGVDDLDVSLHGPDARVHDWHTRVEGSFEQTTSGIVHAAAAGISVGVTSVVTRSNFRHVADLVRVAARLGAARVHFAAAVPRGAAEAAFDSVVPRFALFAEPLGEALSVGRRLGIAIVVSGVPACFLGEQAVASLDLARRMDDVARTHVPACEPCKWRDVCAGPPIEYVRRFGGAEIVARIDDPPDVPAPLRAAAERFAGPGPMEEVRAERLPERPPPAEIAPATLRELGKPAPGLHEIRLAKRKTGEALEAIFPALFEKEG